MKKRVISAIVALAIFIPIIIVGGFIFEIAAAVLAVLGFRELLKLSNKHNDIPLVVLLLSYLCVVLMTLSNDEFLASICLSTLFIFTPLIFLDSEKYNFDRAIRLFGMIFFSSLVFFLMCYVRSISLDEFVYIILIALLSDVFAYFVGSLFGKHKLLPNISPNKTIEGSIGGLVISVTVASIYYVYMIDPGVNIPYIIIVTIILSIFGQLGDLVFSSIKRQNGIKDFSNIMPGHGGIFDRFDSIVFISITYIIIKSLFL